MPIRGWDSAAEARLKGENVSEVLLFRLDAGADGPQRLWTGDFDFPVPADGVVETDDCIYSGVGQVVGALPALTQLVNGQAERISFTLSGVSPELVALATDDIATVPGAGIDLGFCMLDGDLQRCTPIAWVAHLEGQFLTLDRQDSGGAPVRTIGLTASTLFTIRQQPRGEFWTPQGQRLRSAGDSFFDRVPGLTKGKTRKFGPNDA